MTPERDPRIDPRPRDMLRKGKYTRLLLEVEYGNEWVWIRCLETLTRQTLSPSTRYVHPSLRQWQAWAAGAEVLDRGE